MDYNIKVNLLTLSRVKDLMTEFGIDDIPTDDSKSFAEKFTFLVSSEKLNEFIQIMTGSNANFMEEVHPNKIIEILTSFFEQLGEQLRLQILMFSVELKNLKMLDMFQKMQESLKNNFTQETDTLSLTDSLNQEI